MLPDPPYYAVIFSSSLRDAPHDEYARTATRILELARTMPGFLGFESAREHADGIAVSYWESLEAIAAWRDNAEHRLAREHGRAQWYAAYTLRIAKIERQYQWSRKGIGQEP